jgi:hypothetical protein
MPAFEWCIPNSGEEQCPHVCNKGEHHCYVEKIITDGDGVSAITVEVEECYPLALPCPVTCPGEVLML